MLKVAAETFDVRPRDEAVGNRLHTHRAEGVYTPLRSSLILLDDGRLQMALLTSHFGGVMALPISKLLRRRVADKLNLPIDRVLMFSSHNHCSPLLSTKSGWDADLESEMPETDLEPEGHALLEGYLRAAADAAQSLQPAEIRYGLGHERRISYNRKGRRADGSTYLMRETDRLLLGKDFCGDIDDDAPVVGFFNAANKPIAFLTQFTAHPVTAYHCEHVILHGEYPQIACDDLSAAFGGVPVAFMQGCAGDVNSKGLLSTKPAAENVRDAERFGHYLGDTYRQTAAALKRSKRCGLNLGHQEVVLPFGPLPAARSLERRLREVEAFMERCERNDEPGTRACDGLNFPVNMTPAYRKTLIEPTRQWLTWALDLHRQGRANQAPRGVSFDVAAIRIGDVGLVGLTCEPFLGIGRQIKLASPLPLTISCGYMNHTRYNYVPDCPNCGDIEYMSSFYRYKTGELMPYRKPAGDRLAKAGVRMLRQFNRENR